MQVPTSPNNERPQQEQPSTAALLMAAAHMQSQGRFKMAGDIVPNNLFQALSGYREALRVESDPDYFKKLKTNETLSRALGGSNVLSMTPKDK